MLNDRSADAVDTGMVGAAVEFVRLTHPMVPLGACVSLYARVLHAALRGECVRQLSETALRSPTLDVWETCVRYRNKAER
ncbi:hypothetical protein GJAV_G00259660 [Gymnothorax javanicus]|nr:hypothetical protein GJAV_G00259660 [Gymnothorax javanicus]